jgi:hypothetical protein
MMDGRGKEVFGRDVQKTARTGFLGRRGIKMQMDVIFFFCSWDLACGADGPLLDVCVDASVRLGKI